MLPEWLIVILVWLELGRGRKSVLISDVIVNPPDLFFKHRQVLLDNSPGDLDIHTKVFMCDDVSHVADSSPINLRVIGFDFSWHLSARFADHLKIPEDGVKCLSITRQLIRRVYAIRELLDICDGVKMSSK